MYVCSITYNLIWLSTNVNNCLPLLLTDPGRYSLLDLKSFSVKTGPVTNVHKNLRTWCTPCILMKSIIDNKLIINNRHTQRAAVMWIHLFFHLSHLPEQKRCDIMKNLNHIVIIRMWTKCMCNMNTNLPHIMVLMKWTLLGRAYTRYERG